MAATTELLASISKARSVSAVKTEKKQIVVPFYKWRHFLLAGGITIFSLFLANIAAYEKGTSVEDGHTAYDNFTQDQDPALLNFEVFMVDSRGIGVNLTRSEGGDLDAHMSPDGELIALISHRNGEPDLYIIPLNDPNHPMQITNNSEAETINGWLDEKHLLFHAGNEENSTRYIYDTERQETVTAAS